MSLYRQAFWKLLELGLIPDYYVRSKVRNGLIDQIKEMNQDREKAIDTNIDLIDKLETNLSKPPATAFKAEDQLKGEAF